MIVGPDNPDHPFQQTLRERLGRGDDDKTLCTEHEAGACPPGCEHAYALGEYRTRSGRVLTDADIEALADEAERGYDVSQLRELTPEERERLDDLAIAEEVAERDAADTGERITVEELAESAGVSLLERIVQVHPAWDKRDPDPKKNYGLHGVDLRFVVKGPRGAVQFLLSTGWVLPESVGMGESGAVGSLSFKYGEALSQQRVSGMYPMPVDLGYHSLTPMYEGQDPITGEGGCEFLDGRPCYYDGSGLNAERPFEVMLREGSDGLWAYLEDYYYETFGRGDD